MAEKNRKKGAAAVVEGILIAVVIIVIALMLVIYFSFSNTGSAPGIFGYTFYHTKAVSMEPDIPCGSAVIAMPSEIENIRVGSAVLCKIGDDTVLSRVVQLVDEEGVLSYVVKFDTAPANDTFKIPAENIIAKAIWTSRALGSVFSFATSTFGIMIVIIIPSLIIIISQVIKIMAAQRREEAQALSDGAAAMTIRDDIFEMGSEKTESEDFSAALSFEVPEEETGREVLNVDRNGKAELKFTTDESAPLFTYDNIEKPVPVLVAADEFSAEDTVEDEPAGTLVFENEPKEEQGSTDFMSNVIPTDISAAVSSAERPEKVSVTKAEIISPVKEMNDDKVIKKVTAVPVKAVKPREKIAPAPRKSTSRTINDLMSIIDAEQSKLK